MIAAFIATIVILLAIAGLLGFLLRNAMIQNTKLEEQADNLLEQLITSFEVVASREAYIEVINTQLRQGIQDIKTADTHKFYEQDELMSVIFEEYQTISDSLETVIKGYSNELKVRS